VLGGQLRAVPDHVKRIGGGQVEERADVPFGRGTGGAGEPVPERHWSVLDQSRVHDGPVAAGIQVHQRLGTRSDQICKSRPFRHTQQRGSVAVGAAARVAQARRLQLIAGAPVREQVGDPADVLIQRAARMLPPVGPAPQQEHAYRVQFGGHGRITSRGRCPPVLGLRDRWQPGTGPLPRVAACAGAASVVLDKPAVYPCA